MQLHAKASISTTVTLNDFLGQNFSGPIIQAGVGIAADRCSVDTTKDTTFSIFGLDLIAPEDLGIPKINSNDPNVPPAELNTFTTNCRAALNKFENMADRTKKAFRDAQQLVSQYHNARSLGKLLTNPGDLCQQVKATATNVPFFPGGNDCPIDEPVEITINRFIKYYQRPGGELSRLQEAASALSKATNALTTQPTLANPTIKFLDITGEESQTIVNVPFLLGPVPMVLQVDVFATYGVSGNFDLVLKFPARIGMEAGGAPVPVAHIGTNVVPYASAGLSAFVGAGIDLGVIKATVGIEGALTLAQISAPIFAGAGLDMLVTKDVRPLPADILPPVSLADAFPLGVPTAFKFLLTYDYGAGIDLNNVLSGTINGRLRIKFFFFSRTWRKRVVAFNGWSHHFDIISGSSGTGVRANQQTTYPPRGPDGGAVNTRGSSTNVATGQVPMGLSEPQLPLTELAYLTVPDAEPPPDASVAGFDASAVQGFFYDDLCCLKPGTFCFPAAIRPVCCPGSVCTAPPPPDGGISIATCTVLCKNESEACTQSSDCCSGLVCGSLQKCTKCGGEGEACRSNNDCCSISGTQLVCGLSNQCEVPIIPPR